MTEVDNTNVASDVLPGEATRAFVAAVSSQDLPRDIPWELALPPVRQFQPGTPLLELPDAADCPVTALLRDTNAMSRAQWVLLDDVFPWGRSARHFGVLGGRGSSVVPRRPIPSAGGLDSADLYVAGLGLPPGTHYYDPAHHRLRPIGPEQNVNQLVTTLTDPVDEPPHAVLCVVSSFSRLSFKYGEFGYRLSCLDTGVVAGQLSALVSEHGYRAELRLRFDDCALDAMLGLEPLTESVHAVLLLWRTGPVGRAAASAPPIPVPPQGEPAGLGLHGLPLASALHRASLDCRRPVPAAAPPAARFVGEIVTLPEYRVDLAEGVHRRRSTLGGFGTESLTSEQLAAILDAATTTIGHDVPGLTDAPVACLVNRVDGVPPGAYLYEPGTGLVRLRAGEVWRIVTAGMGPLPSKRSVAESACCLFPVADYESGLPAYGDRWYRMRNIAAGMAVERAVLAAAAAGLVTRPVMDFYQEPTDSALGLSELGLTSMILLQVGTRSPRDHRPEYPLPGEAESGS
jgi:SagB-type dehydrogenase family enzyme